MERTEREPDPRIPRAFGRPRFEADLLRRLSFGAISLLWSSVVFWLYFPRFGIVSVLVPVAFVGVAAWVWLAPSRVALLTGFLASVAVATWAAWRSTEPWTFVSPAGQDMIRLLPAVVSLAPVLCFAWLMVQWHRYPAFRPGRATGTGSPQAASEAGSRLVRRTLFYNALGTAAVAVLIALTFYGTYPSGGIRTAPSRWGTHAEPRYMLISNEPRGTYRTLSERLAAEVPEADRDLEELASVRDGLVGLGASHDTISRAETLLEEMGRRYPGLCFGESGPSPPADWIEARALVLTVNRELVGDPGFHRFRAVADSQLLIEVDREWGIEPGDTRARFRRGWSNLLVVKEELSMARQAAAMLYRVAQRVVTRGGRSPGEDDQLREQMGTLLFYQAGIELLPEEIRSEIRQDSLTIDNHALWHYVGTEHDLSLAGATVDAVLTLNDKDFVKVYEDVVLGEGPLPEMAPLMEANRASAEAHQEQRSLIETNCSEIAGYLQLQFPDETYAEGAATP